MYDARDPARSSSTIDLERKAGSALDRELGSEQTEQVG